MIFTLFKLFISYLIIGFFVAILGSRYVYNREKTHDSGIKEIKGYFLYFWFVWPVFSIALIIDYCDENKLLDKFFTNIIIKDKKND